jgi:glycerol kinase
VVWDSTTGEPLSNAIVWSDTRTQAIVHRLRKQEGSQRLARSCGIPLSTYSSGVKLVWLLENVVAVKQAYENGTLAFGTIDSWLIYKLNGGIIANRHVSDMTNASRTMFADIETLRYDEDLLRFFGIDKSKVQLPRIVSSTDQSAFGRFCSGPLKDIPVTGCLGDQSAALLGHRRCSVGTAKNTYGTGCFVLYNTGEVPVFSQNGLLTTVAYALPNQKPVYALEGSIAVAGSAVKFLRDNLGIIKESSEVNELAMKVPDNGGVTFVTAFSGLFAPYWIDDAKGTLFGITHHTTGSHIARAVLEACCLQTEAVLGAMERDSGKKLSSLAVDGGLSNSDLCMQVSFNEVINVKV